MELIGYKLYLAEAERPAGGYFINSQDYNRTLVCQSFLYDNVGPSSLGWKHQGGQGSTTYKLPVQ